MLLSHLSTLCSIQDLQVSHPPMHRASHRLLTTSWAGWLIVNQVTVLTQHLEDSFEAKKKASAIFVRPYSCLRHHMALWPYLQTVASSTRQAHGPNDNGDCPKLQLCPQN